MDKLTTTIKREFLRKIVARTKRVEYREIKPYWVKRLGSVSVPFKLRLINGMQRRTPEVTVVVTSVRRNSRTGYFELHLGRVAEVRNWDQVRERPVR